MCKLSYDHSKESMFAVSVKISNLLICFSSFDLSCSILEINKFIENLYNVLCY